MLAKGEIVTIGCKSHGSAWDRNTHQFVVQRETEDAFVGWSLGNILRDPKMQPCVYPKFAWEVRA